ncbi:MAG TPA: hypothetical protein VK788_16215 [Terriglobales bacterium]|nr:hypothetical protein [Terriglobales bacterium]
MAKSSSGKCAVHFFSMIMSRSFFSSSSVKNRTRLYPRDGGQRNERDWWWLYDSEFTPIGIPWLPVVRSLHDAEPVGCIREEKLLDFMLHNVVSAEEDVATFALAPTKQPLQHRAGSA